jgi:hypothetical protein
MTDLIKGKEEVVSKKLIEWIRRNPQVITDNLKSFRAELADLGRPRPVILAFGGDVHALLAQNLGPAEYSRLVRLPHYSDRISKEQYREDVHQKLGMLRGTA